MGWGEALLCAMSAVLMLTVALKMKPKLKEVNTTIGDQAM